MTQSIKKQSPSKLFIFCIFVFIVVAAPVRAYAQFDVHWGISDDDGRIGYLHLVDWLIENNYYCHLGETLAFAQTGYAGHEATDPDPYLWHVTQPLSVELVGLGAGIITEFGFYTGNGSTLTLTSLMQGGQFSSNQPFGFYIETPEYTWFTDRAENEAQQTGLLQHEGGSPQSLIYELVPNQQWLVAWEQYDATDVFTDRDYNDANFLVTVVPEPLSSALFLLGGGALTVINLRRRKRN